MSRARVSIMMGSDSDWEIMQSCVTLLKEFDLAFEVSVMSAHRTPGDVVAAVKSAGDEGVEVFIAAAGMSAALAGTIAAHTTRPVIGVPISSGPLNGIDALLSTVQMPPGVPVAGMAVGRAGAKNSALLAVQILALQDAKLASKLVEHKQVMADDVRRKNRDLQEKL